MIATYATALDFLGAKDLIDTGGVINNSDIDYDQIYKYLRNATKYIEKVTRRRFIPYVETKTYPVPYRFFDLNIRRYPNAELSLGNDLLEVHRVNNGFEDLEEKYYYTLEHNVLPKSKVVLRYPKYWGSNSSTYNKPSDAVIEIEGLWGYYDSSYKFDAWVDTLEVVETGGITATQSVLSVSDISDSARDAVLEIKFYRGYVLRIEKELLEVVSINQSSNEVTVRRGARGSTAVAHDAGTKIERWQVLPDIQQVCFQVAKNWRENDISIGGDAGITGQGGSAELPVPDSPQSILYSYIRSTIDD